MTPFLHGMLWATCFLLGMALARWRIAAELRGHQKWHEHSMACIRERMAAMEIVMHSMHPAEFQKAQEDLRHALHQLDAGEMPATWKP